MSEQNSGGGGWVLLSALGVGLAAVLKLASHSGDDAIRSIARGVDDTGARAIGRAGEDVAFSTPELSETQLRRDHAGAAARLKDMVPGSSMHEGERVVAQELENSELFLFLDPDKTSVERARLVSFAPENDEEYAAIYGVAPSAFQSRTISRLANVRMNAGSRPVELIRDAEALASYLSGLEEQVVVVIAHSTDNGRMLHFAGLDIALHDLHRTCAQVRKMCLSLTCHSQDLLFGNEITLAEAFKLWRLGQLWVQENPTGSVTQFVAYLRSARGDLVSRQAVTIAWVGSSVVVPAGAALYISDQGTGTGLPPPVPASSPEADRGVKLELSPARPAQ